MVLFVTDGLGTTDTEKVASVANNLSAQVFAINVILSIPKDLQALTVKTNGLYFGRILNKTQFRMASSAIFKLLECTDHGIVKWLSKPDCEITKPVQLKYKNTLVEFDYDVPAGKVGKIDVNPSIIQFGASRAGLEQVQGVRITAQNIPLTLTSASIDPKSPFHKADSISFPQILKPGESFNTRVKFTPLEAGLYETNFRINTQECPETNVRLLAGGEELIKLVFPAGGEVFTVGEDTSVIWEGVKKTQPVEISYRATANDGWRNIGKANYLKYFWHLPGDTGSKFQVKLTPLKLADENLEISSIIENGKVPILSTSFSPDGNRIVTTDKSGFVKTWNPQTAKIITSLGGYDADKAIIPDDERLFFFLKDETFVWNLQHDKITGRISQVAKKVFLSLILPDGSQVLIPANVSTDPAKNARIWSGMFANKVFLFNQPDLKWAAFTPGGSLVVAMDGKNVISVFRTDSASLITRIPFKEAISSVIIAPDGSKALVKLPQEICMISLIENKELFRLSHIQFQKFTANGKNIVTTDKKVIDSSTGLLVLDLSAARLSEFSQKADFVVWNRYDSLYLFDLNTKRNILQLQVRHFAWPGSTIPGLNFIS